MTATVTGADVARLLDKMEVRGPLGCWHWTGALTGVGYGKFWYGGRTHRAHRVSYEHFRGPIPTETLDHLCLNKACLNPAHMEPVSRSENLRRSHVTSPRPHRFRRKL